MNLKGVFVVGVIVIIIVFVVVVPNNIRNTPPSLNEELNMTDSVLINSKLPNNDVIKLEDNTKVEKSSDLEYYLVENGTKHYIIDAKDDVNLSE